MKFRSQIEHQVNDHRLLRASSFSWVDLASHQEQFSKWKFEFSDPHQSLELIFT